MQHENQEFTDDGNDEVRAENALIKLKLELEFGMNNSEFFDVDPIVENQFLSNILELERKYKDARQISIYDFLGRPRFRDPGELMPDEFGVELQRIQHIMEEKNVVLDFIETYPDEVKYRFIAEEFFLKETDDFMVEGMTKCFIYEEFLENPDDD